MTMKLPGLLIAPLLLAGAVPQERTLTARIDQEVARIPGFPNPAPVCSDGEFLRRVMLDLVGYPPSAGEVRAFAGNPFPEKRVAKIDELLAGDRFADFWARRWMAVFFDNYHAFRLEPLKSLPPEDAERLMESFRRWLKARLKEDRSWKAIVQDLLEAEGVALQAPAVVYKLGTMEWPRVPRFENRAVRHFLGIDLSCTGCHDDPFNKFRVEDAYSLMAFSTGRILQRGPKGLELIETSALPGRVLRMPSVNMPLFHPERDPAIKPTFFLNGQTAAPDEVLAKAFARFVTTGDSFQFRSAAVNRLWFWLMGRGIVSPVDEFNLKNKALSRDLLNLLGVEFSARDYSLKALIRSICATDAYQRRSDGPDPVLKTFFARGVIRPLSAEQILGSLEVATRGRASLDVPRAQALAERMIRGDAPICEVTAVRPDARALVWLASGDEVGKMIREGPVLAQIKASADPVKEMFLAALSREPDAAEAANFAAFLNGGDLEEAYRVLLNTTEFLTRH
jgi:hypothetical protein